MRDLLGLSLTLQITRRMVRGLLLETGCHETQMIHATRDNLGAGNARQGTALRSRLESFGSVVWLAYSGVTNIGVLMNPQGGRTP